MPHRQRGYARDVRLHHLALRTDDVDALVGFYRSMLGLSEVRDTRPRSVWLALGGGAVLMIERREAGETARSRDLELFVLDVTEEEKAAVRERAVTASAYDGETAYTVYVRDPDGRRLGVSTYPLPPS